MVGLSVRPFWYELGPGDFVHAVFSTISYHLEPDGWGSRYPILMKSLYREAMTTDLNDGLLKELENVCSLLEDISPDQAIWDIEDMSKPPQWGRYIKSDATSLRDCFINYDGTDILYLFVHAAQTAIEWDTIITLKKM